MARARARQQEAVIDTRDDGVKMPRSAPVGMAAIDADDGALRAIARWLRDSAHYADVGGYYAPLSRYADAAVVTLLRAKMVYTRRFRYY